MLTVDLDRLGVGPGQLLLDLGCGGGRHAFAAMERGATVVALDASADELRAAGAIGAALADQGAAGTLALVRGDALRLPFRDASVDRVIASEVLEHVSDDRVVFAEIARVLRPGGRVALSVPRTAPEVVCWALSDAYHNRPGGHVRIFGRSELLRRATAAGLSVEGWGWAHGLHSPYWWLRALVGVDREDHPLVRAYHRLLVWEIERRPASLRHLSAVIDPLLGKSMVLYAHRPRALAPTGALGEATGLLLETEPEPVRVP
jgi:SAM-dependent methyltransferase